MWILVGILAGIVVLAFVALVPFFVVLFVGERILDWLPLGRPGRYVLILVKGLRRNLLRTALTYLATFILVVVVTMIWAALYYLEVMTADRAGNVKALVTERWEAMSQLPWAYAAPLSEGAYDSARKGDVRPEDSMTWQFYVATVDPAKKTRESMLFFIAMDPAKILTMMEELINDINPLETKHRPRPTLAEIDAFRQVVERMKKDKRIIILGKEKLKSINKQVGDRLTLTGINYQDINLEVEIAGVFPSGKYEDTCVMHFDYLNDSIAAYPQAHGGQKHPLADKSLNLVWLKVKGPKAYHRIAQQIEASTQFRDPSVKIETLSAAIAASLDRLQSLIWGLKYLISPAILLTMTLVVANAISISARERRAELAVLKVFGFLPGHLLLLVLGEAVVIGVVGGGLSSTLSFVGLNYVLPRLGESGNSLFVPTAALWWGPILGAGTAVLGSIVPAWGACRVRVAEVFARVG